MVNRPVTVEDHVRAYFSDEPILADIAACESRFRHFGRNGKPLKGEKNPYDLGVMQINTLYHGFKAEELGLNLKNIGDNMAYARYLYDKEGTQPWTSSERCWGKKLQTGSKDTAKKSS